MSLFRQSIALVLITKNKETKHCIHQKNQRHTEEFSLANKTHFLVWYAFYDIRRPGNGSYSYDAGAHMGQFISTRP